MADLFDGEEYEVKDEELVDFEGSDYGFGSDEELYMGGDVAGSSAMDEDGPNVKHAEKQQQQQEETEKIAKGGRGREQRPPEPEEREAAESGEIEEERDEKEDGVVAQPVPSLSPVAYREACHHEGRVGEPRRRHRKADLEDGELDDAAMPEGSDHEAEGNAAEDEDDETDRRERKRRKDRFTAERQSEDLGRKDRESETNVPGSPRSHHVRGGGRQLDRSGGLSKAGNSGGRGMMQMDAFNHPPSMAPGIMGPGRPPLPVDMRAGMVLNHPLGRGYTGPLAGMPLPGAVNMSQFQEAMAEHMFRSHRMMQQLANAGGPGRPPMAGPLGAPTLQPMVGLDFGGPLPCAIMHVQQQSPELASQMNFVGHMDSYPISPRPNYGSGRGVAAAGSIYGQAAGRVGSSPRNSMGRHWPISGTDVHLVGRGGGQGRGQGPFPAWADPQGMAMAHPAAGQVSAAQHTGNMGQPVGPNVMGAGAKVRQGSHVSSAQGNPVQREGTSSTKRIEADGTRRIDADRSSRNGGSNPFRTGSNHRSSSGSGTGSKRERENGRYRDSQINKNSSRGNGANNVPASVSNLIQLGGPVQKSRLLTVSGLPENTSMSIVVEAFEKQGKVTDFRKEERGDAFTITFASVPEAISAKRHLHRSIIAGRQITVEYALQLSDS